MSRDICTRCNNLTLFSPSGVNKFNHNLHMELFLANLLKYNIHANQKYRAQWIFTKWTHLCSPHPQQLHIPIMNSAYLRGDCSPNFQRIRFFVVFKPCVCGVDTNTFFCVWLPLLKMSVRFIQGFALYGWQDLFIHSILRRRYQYTCVYLWMHRNGHDHSLR